MEWPTFNLVTLPSVLFLRQHETFLVLELHILIQPFSVLQAEYFAEKSLKS